MARGRAREAKQLARRTVIVCELTADRRNSYTFHHRFAQVRAAASAAAPSIADALFLDLRDTAVTRLALAGCTIPEICAITGHGKRSAYDTLKHYLASWPTRPLPNW